MTKITDISPYFQLKNNQWIFTGKKLEVYIPEIYASRGLLTLGNSAVSLGVLQLKINDKFDAALLLLTLIDIDFESTTTIAEDDCSYVVLNVLPGQAFIKNNLVVKNPNLIYSIFMTFIALGKIPPFLSYNNVQSLFDNDSMLFGANLGVNHAIWEMIYAHMYRDKEDPYKLYRYTDMKADPQIVALRTISHMPSSVSARIIGSYMADGIVSSLVDNVAHESSVVENLLR